jgi:hypothetical protein
MSTYKPNSNIKDRGVEKSKGKMDGVVKDLRNWVSKQEWSTGSISDSVVRGIGGDEITLLIHGSNVKFDEVIKKIKTTDFIKLGINIKFKSSEKASWNYSTYFLDFTFLGK